MSFQNIIFATTMFLGTLSSVEAATVPAQDSIGASAPTPFQVAVLSGARRSTSTPVRLGVFSDNGLVIEFAVSCGAVGGMLTYSRSEDLFCDPEMRCSTSKFAAIASLCEQ